MASNIFILKYLNNDPFVPFLYILRDFLDTPPQNIVFFNNFYNIKLPQWNGSLFTLLLVLFYLSKLVLDCSLVTWICYFINWYLVFQFFFFFNYAKSKTDPIFKIFLNVCLYFWLCFSNKSPSFTTSLMFSSYWRMFSKFYLLKKNCSHHLKRRNLFRPWWPSLSVDPVSTFIADHW